MKVIRTMYSVLLIVIFALQAVAQDKKMAGPEEYSKWYDLQQTKVSNDGSWFAHVRSNQRAGMFLVRLADNTELFVEGAVQFDFTEDNRFLIVQGSKRSFLKDLKTADRKSTRLNSSHVKSSYAVF